MPSINKVLILGHLGRDPEIKANSAGTVVALLNVATSSRKRNQLGQYEVTAEWHRVILFGQNAEFAKQFLKKGNAVFVEGELHTRQFTDTNNNTRYVTEIIGKSVQGMSTGEITQPPAQKAPTTPQPVLATSAPINPATTNQMNTDSFDCPF